MQTVTTRTVDFGPCSCCSSSSSLASFSSSQTTGWVCLSSSRGGPTTGWVCVSSSSSALSSASLQQCATNNDCTTWNIRYLFRAPCGDYSVCENAGGTFFFEEDMGDGTCFGECRFPDTPAGTFPLPPCGLTYGLNCGDGGFGFGPKYPVVEPPPARFRYCCDNQCQNEPCSDDPP